jgi:hypothetical protein
MLGNLISGSDLHIIEYNLLRFLIVFNRTSNECVEASFQVYVI